MACTPLFRPVSLPRSVSLLVAVLVTLLMCALAAPSAAAAQTEPMRWQWPMSPPPAVVRGFEPPGSPYGPGHRGIDLAGRLGTPVLAVASGTVTFAGRVAGIDVVVVDHGALDSTYQPVLPVVRVGERGDGRPATRHPRAGTLALSPRRVPASRRQAR